ncbi:hypothetical protein VU08_09065, partial [Desulfobulbus sp. F5]|nr:hypothetical protein [Desulfobulbus sp. F5]
METASFAASGTVTIVRGGYAVTEELQITMDEKGIIIPNLALAGYRSFGKELQYFDQFAKINLFIGKNNAGKSNVLRFLSEVYPQVLVSDDWDKWALSIKLNLNLSQHVSANSPIFLGIGEDIDSELQKNHRLVSELTQRERTVALKLLEKLKKEKRKIDNTNLCWTLISLSSSSKEVEFQKSWFDAIKVLSTKELYNLWSMLEEGYLQNPQYKIE